MKRKSIAALLFMAAVQLSACSGGASQEDHEESAIELEEVVDIEISEEITPPPITTAQPSSEEIGSLEDSLAESSNEPTRSEELEKYIAERECKENAPSNFELMAYAQTVFEDFYPNPKYSRNERDYLFVGTDLRYKIEGRVSVDSVSPYEDFNMIIKFTDEDYDAYDLVSLQVGDTLIYKSQTAYDAEANPAKDPILNEENTKIYNEVMHVLEDQYERDEDEILEEMAPRYNMTVDELRQFMFDYMDAFYLD